MCWPSGLITPSRKHVVLVVVILCSVSCIIMSVLCDWSNHHLPISFHLGMLQLGAFYKKYASNMCFLFIYFKIVVVGFPICISGSRFLPGA